MFLNKKGHFGIYGGLFAPEIMIPALFELEKTYKKAKRNRKFKQELEEALEDFSGRPTPLYFAENLTKKLGGAKIYIKREDLSQTGAHKINNTLGQAILAKRMGKKRLVAETGAGQHGVSVATAAAKFNLKCTVYMGEKDYYRQRPNVFWMQRLGAEVKSVTEGTKVLKDAVNAAIKDWITNIEDTHFLLGSAVGPHPYPTIVRDFQSIIGKEVKWQIKEKEKHLPDYLIACVGGGSNAIGLFHPFLKKKKIKMIGVEAGGTTIKRGKHAARFASKDGKIGVVEGYKSYFLQDENGNLLPTSSISAGLDYAGVGPEHSYLHDLRRVHYTYALDKDVITAFNMLTKHEGLICALESAHAFAEAIKLAPVLPKDKIIVVNMSGRGDKDIFIIAEALKDNEWKEFIKKKAEKYRSDNP